MSNKFDPFTALDWGKLLFHFFGIKGFDVGFKPQYSKYGEKITELVTLTFYFTNFKYLQSDSNGRWNEVKSCDEQSLPERESLSNHSFRLSIKFNRYNTYTENTCPVLFRNASLEVLEISGLTDSLIKVCKIGFQNFTSNNQTIDLGFNMKEFYMLAIYMVRLNARIFHHQLFANKLKIMEIRGHAQSIELGFLRHVRVRNLRITITNLREFLHLNPKWIENFPPGNFKSTIIIIQKMGQILDWEDGMPSELEFKQVYSYGDEDLCLFSFYPVKKKNVEILLENLEDLELTCSALFLMYSSLTSEDSDKKKDAFKTWRVRGDQSLYDLFINRSALAAAYKECNLKERLKLCEHNASVSESGTQHQASIYDILLIIQFTRFTMSTVLQPLISVLGITLGLLSIWTLNKMKTKTRTVKDRLLGMKQFKLFEYMQFNAFFGILYNLSMISRLLGDCLEYGSIYCSPWFANDSMRLIMLINSIYLASSFRMCMNLSNLAFTFIRYLMNAAPKRLERITKLIFKLSPRYAILVMVIVTLLLNVVVLYYNDLDTIHTLVTLPRYDLFMYDRRFFINEENPVYMWIYLALVVLNDIVIIFVSLFLDYSLLSFIRSRPKMEMKNAFSKRSEKESAEKKLSQLIVTNGAIGLLIRLPHSAISLYKLNDQLFFEDTYGKMACFFENSITSSPCINLYSIAESILSLSTVSDFFLFMKFNSSFSEAMKFLMIELFVRLKPN
nr:G protein-coupled receptor [Proales similis]